MTTQFALKMLVALTAAAAISFLTTPLVKSLAYRVGAIDVPKDNRRMHKTPIPRLGGLAIFIAFLLTTLIFADIDRQRMALQHYVSAERETLVAQAQQAADDAIAKTLAALPALVGKVVFWIVLLVAALVGVPFLLGFWAGGWRERARRRKADRTKQE